MVHRETKTASVACAQRALAWLPEPYARLKLRHVPTIAILPPQKPIGFGHICDFQVRRIPIQLLAWDANGHRAQ
jgi:hypothetical protein